jgi:hypothetical protein
MRHPLRNLMLFVAVLAIGIGATTRLQRPDLTGSIYPAVSTTPKALAGTTPDTGRSVDLANYASVFFVVSVGHSVDSVNNRRYAVVQDDVSGTWTSEDSVQIDTVDFATYKLGYKLNQRFVRGIIRASNVGDTVFEALTFMRGYPRFRN